MGHPKTTKQTPVAFPAYAAGRIARQQEDGALGARATDEGAHLVETVCPHCFETVLAWLAPGQRPTCRRCGWVKPR